MAIDMETGKHICYGLYFGKGCDDCKRNYPHLLAKTPEEIERGVQHMQLVEAALTSAINEGAISEGKARAINESTLTPVSDLPPVASVQPSTTAARGGLSLAKLAPGFVQDMLAVPYTAPASNGRWAKVRQFFGRPQREFVVPPGTPSTRLVFPNVKQFWIGDFIFPRRRRDVRQLRESLLSRVSRFLRA